MRWLYCNRTKITGYLGVALGFLELNADTVGQWVSAPKRGSLLLCIGLLTAMIGHYNASQHKD